MNLKVIWAPILNIKTKYQYIQYRALSSSTWINTPNMIPTMYQYVITGLSTGVQYVFRLVNVCVTGEVLYGDTLAYYPANPTTCCPTGYSPSSDNTECVSIDTSTDATQLTPGSSITAQHTSYTWYGRRGMVVYKQNGYNVDGTWDTSNSTLFPNIYTSLAASKIPNANVISYTSGIWINKNLGTAQDGSAGRMNQCAIWKQNDLSYIGTLGFARSFDVTTAGWYYIGTGSDNNALVKLNGSTIYRNNNEAIGNSTYLNVVDPTFGFWSVIPVYLETGSNVIELSVENLDTTGSGADNPGALAAEVYSATEAQLIACTSITDLAQYTLFSTKNIVDGDVFDVGNYSCATGTLVNINGAYKCQITSTTPFISC